MYSLPPLPPEVRAKISAASKLRQEALWQARIKTLTPEELAWAELQRGYHRKWRSNLTPKEYAAVVEGRNRRANARNKLKRQAKKKNGQGN
jgi:hypothetical protein